MSILSAARLFEIPDLSTRCLESLKNKVSEENAIHLCELGKEINNSELRDAAFLYMCK
jgi:hypothetical protein